MEEELEYINRIEEQYYLEQNWIDNSIIIN